MLVIAVTGMPGAGKSEVVKVLGKEGRVFVMGDIVREYTRRKGLELTPENVGRVANHEREIYGMDIWARRTVERILMESGDLAVVDGLRGTAEVEAFRREFAGSFRLIAVMADASVRYRRMDARTRPDDSTSLGAHMARDEREISWGMAEAMGMADDVIINEGTLEELKNTVVSLLREFRPL